MEELITTHNSDYRQGAKAHIKTSDSRRTIGEIKEDIMYQEAGHCVKCGAPYYVPSVWHGITPPTPIPNCVCWNTVKTYTTSSTSDYVTELNEVLSLWLGDDGDTDAIKDNISKDIQRLNAAHFG